MNQQDAKKLLEDLAQQGVHPGQWFGVQQGAQPNLSEQKAALIQIRDLLTGQLTSSLAQLDEATQQLERAKHGGGR